MAEVDPPEPGGTGPSSPLPPARKPGPWRSVRVRITAVSVLVFALAFGAAAFATVRSVRGALVDQVAADLNGAQDGITQRLSQGQAMADAVRAPSGVLVCRADAGGQPAGGVPPCPGREPGEEPGREQSVAAPAAGPGVGGTFSVGGPGFAPGDVLVETVEVSTPSGPVSLQLIGPLAGVQRSVDALTRVLVVGTPALVLTVGVMVWWLVGRALRPVERLRAEVDAISHSTLGRRLRTPDSHDEIDRLAHTMNDMLDRLQGAAVEQQRFVSDASHELRTPLSVIRTALDVTRLHPGSLPPAEALDRIDTAATRTEELVAELLELARIEDPGAGPPPVEVHLDEVVARAVADIGHDRVTVSGTAGRVAGDPAQLRRLVGNLVGNAVGHARGQVVVRIGDDHRSAVLVVDDDGPGIPADQRATVFRRFARLDGSRLRAPDGGGWGLGLAIAAAVVRRHGGTIEIGDAPIGGARVTVRLPTVT
jgi:signal transduction histidine kinase